jgi:hypothetical protein
MNSRKQKLWWRLMAALRRLKKAKRWADANDVQARWCRWAALQFRR